MKTITRLFMLISALCLLAGHSAVHAETIRIGATLSATGHFSSEIGPFKKLFNAWADGVNKKGGIYLKDLDRGLKVEVVTYDDQSQVPVVSRFYERLIEKDDVDILIGPYSSPLTFAATIPAEKNGIPFIAICANSPKIYNRGFRWVAGVIDLAPRYTYRYWEMVKAEGKAKTVAFIVEDTMHPRGVYNGSKKLAEDAGLTITMTEIVPPDIQEFGGLISRLKKAGSDIIYVSSNIPLAISFMKQAKEKGLKAREFHCIHHSGVFKDALGGGAEGVVGQSYWSKGMGLEGENDFLSILKQSGIDPDSYPWAPAYMSAFQMVEEAFIRAGSKNKNAFMKALKTGSYKTLCGINRVHESGHGDINTYPSQILNGQYEIIWPPERITRAHVYPSKGF